jgi:hypothetical protein
MCLSKSVLRGSRYRAGQSPVAGRHPSTSIEGGLAIIGDDDMLPPLVGEAPGMMRTPPPIPTPG